MSVQFWIERPITFWVSCVQPPAIANRKIARQASFDPALKLAQDTDFLLQIMLGRRYALTDTASYAYTEVASRTPQKILAGYRFSQQIFRKYLEQYPSAARRELYKYRAKHTILSLLDRAGLANNFSIRGLPKPEYDELSRQR